MMANRRFLNFVGFLFAATALLHALRIVLGWQVRIGQWEVPVALSAAGLAVSTLLAWVAFRFARH